jgi:hypothetical protein
MNDLINDVKLRSDEENEFIEVFDEGVDDGYAINLDNIQFIDTNGFGHLVITAKKPGGDETAEYVFIVGDDQANEIMGKWSNWYQNKEDKPETVNMEIQVKNNDENRLRIGEQLTGVVGDIEEYEAELDDLRRQTKSINEKVKAAHEKLIELKRDYRADYINRAMECIIQRDYEAGIIRFLDPATAEVLESRKMTLEEKQASMEFDETEKKEQEAEEITEQDSNEETEENEGIDLGKKEAFWNALTADYFKKFWDDDINEEVLKKLKPIIMEEKSFEVLIKDASRNEYLDDDAGQRFYDLCLDIMLEKEMI